ncbi:CYTH domain-containing protein [Draconibacterium sp. IB214405]|uniref:CYTH domain-containing protein n=1 Tax=Draconibacterium sp. IB214405 TaxID=3097352 RepID=UPI002A15E9B7|nr:CYTH domain-containing protein [Draconibacterium sp. IB214405]MDX8339673.1 CYTH domain-containing protein [Draconibacterium sp. IB214405]
MIEIERKFLVDTNKWSPKDSGNPIVQGYLSTDKERVVRVRIKGDRAWLTIKGKTQGISRIEMEYEIPVQEAEVLLELCHDFPIRKKRYVEEIYGMTWEIDVFEDKNNGLVLAEVELSDENEKVELPDWVTEEVSADHRYFNAWLSEHPFVSW